MRQLTNRTNYETLDSDPTGNLCKEIQETLDDMRDNNNLSKKAHKFLSPTDCRTARFYLLPKVYKPGNPGRPIIYGNGSPTEHISLFVDGFLKPLVPRISSYIHDFLRRILDIQHQVPRTATIGTFDVSSFHQHSPRRRDWCLLQSFGWEWSYFTPITDTVTLMNHVLTKNNFTFLDTNYLCTWCCDGHTYGAIYGLSLHGQTRGTHVCFRPRRPWTWWRYINEIFFIWTSDEESLTRLIDHMNSFHRTIKFTSEYSIAETHFLYVVIHKEENNYWSFCQAHG